MDDPELEKIRQQRLAEMQSQFGAGGNDSGNKKEQEDKLRQQEDAKNSILSQILDQSARARLNTLMIGKPEKGKMVENMLLQMAQYGQIRGRINEDKLIELLENVNKQMGSHKTTVKFDRRRAALDSDDEF